jgi:hypothetical protein
MSSTDMCFSCGGYVPEGRQICKACEDANVLAPMDETPDGIIRKYRPAIIRAARAHPAKTIDQQAVYELGKIGLSFFLAEMADWKDTSPMTDARNMLIKAIAETRVLVERLAIVHCSSAQDADSYRFYLAQAAKQSDPSQVKR